METAINVGNKVEKETVENLKEIVGEVFKVGHDNHMDQETVRAALHMIGKVVEVKNITITNCNIVGDKIVNMDEDK